MGNFAVIFPAAGRSSRFGDSKQKKVFAELDGRAVWLRAVEPFINRDDVAQTIAVIAPEDRELFERRFRPSVAFMNIQVIEGGAERSDSVARALEVLDPACEFVAVHDAARPCLTSELVDAVFDAARAHGAALLALPVADTLKRAGADQFTTETLPRDGLYLAQTPQVFRRDLLQRALALTDEDVTDEAALVEQLGVRVAIFAGDEHAFKVTTPLDFLIAQAILERTDGQSAP